jgi:hypothetical protein
MSSAQESAFVKDKLFYFITVYNIVNWNTTTFDLPIEALSGSRIGELRTNSATSFATDPWFFDK